MKKLLSIVFASVLLITGCSTKEEATPTPNASNEHTEHQHSEMEKKEQKLTINITNDKATEKLQSKEVEIKEGDILMDVMQNNFEIETAYEGAFITSIDGVVADEKEKYAWMFSVNGEPATKGAKDITLKPGDVVDFDLQKWE